MPLIYRSYVQYEVHAKLKHITIGFNIICFVLWVFIFILNCFYSLGMNIAFCNNRTSKKLW